MIGIFLLASVIATAPPPQQRFDPLKLEDLEALGPLLRARVAHVEVKITPEKGQPNLIDARDGFGVPLDDRLVVVMSLIIQGEKHARISGPKGSARAKVLLEDPERRVAILEAERPLASLGLFAPPLAPVESRKAEAPVFALMSTEPEGGVVSGEVLADGTEQELEGHPRISLKLRFGMPVFDDRARLVGYSRAVAWDTDQFLIVPPEMITAARTATASAAKAPHPQEQTRPWWGK